MAKSDYHHGDLRRALLDAAERLVRREGASGASLRAIAREAGVSPAAPYHHFDDRESLLADVAASGFESLRDAMVEAATTSVEEDPLRRLQAAGIAYVDFAVANPRLFRLMFGGLVSDRTRFPRLRETAHSTSAVLEALMGEGEGSRTEGGLPSVALAAWSTVHGLAFLMVEGLLAEESASRSTEEIARRVTTVLGRGLRSYAAASGE